MPPSDLRARTKAFALNAIRLIERLPHSRTADVIGRQLLRSATSVGANYRAACVARSRAEFISRMGIVQEEVDESVFWMELLCESGIVHADVVEALRQEGRELFAIAVSSIKTAKSRKNQPESRSSGREVSH